MIAIEKYLFYSRHILSPISSLFIVLLDLNSSLAPVDNLWCSLKYELLGSLVFKNKNHQIDFTKFLY